jgi:error-prone DNA polymerase
LILVPDFTMYIELHAHSNFSLLDGASHPEDLIARAARMEMGALALTDHDGLYAACRFYKAARGAGIKPLIGAELTLKEGPHMTLLVENRRGYVNLSQLITKAHVSGSKGNPCLSFSDLAGRTEGLICLSGCGKGAIPALLKERRREEALTAAAEYASLFGARNFYIELQHHLNHDDTKLCGQLTDIAGRLGLPVVASNNVHYAVREDFRLHDVLTCIRNRVTLDLSTPFRKPNSEYYLKGYKEMVRLPAIPHEAIKRTAEIGERCTFELDFSSYSFPDFPLPEGETPAPCLRRLSLEKAQRRYGELTEALSERLNHELQLIERKGLSGYFLIVRDIMEFAKRAGISAQGRGSAASSVVAYVLGITPVDPIKHSLFVGRFLNEFAVPDIDIDIASHRREEVIQYVYEKYGADHAAMVCTYITFQARNGIREVGKALGLPLHILDRMARTVSSYGGTSGIETLREIPEFKGYLSSEAWRHFCSLCTKIAYFPRHLSIHVGGMLVTSKPISEIVPLENARSEGRVVCQWDKDSVDDAGLIKIDLLGLRMLSMIDEIRELVKEHRGMEIDFDNLSTDDPKVYDLIAKADTIGIFQVESRAQMQTLPKVNPRSIEDLAVEVAIIRPGPLQGNMVHPYIRRRQGIEPVVHLHPRLAPILDETLGVILFQEQILQVACEIAGFSTGEANNLRKAMGRKHARAELEKWYARFVAGAGARGVEESMARKIFDHISGFAEFGFCKSHAASFAILCYRSAFLKTYYPAEFYCALLNNQPMGFYIPEVITGDAKRHGVEILPVDISRSLYKCSIEKGALRIGFRYVKEMGEEKVKPIVAERERAPFLSLQDFVERTGLDREALQNLIVIGAFDGIRRSRRQLLWDAGTMSAGSLSAMMRQDVREEVPLDEMSGIEETLADYRVQGFSPSNHLLQMFRKKLGELGGVMSSRLAELPSGTAVKIGGYCVCLQVPGTAKGFAFLTLEDEEGLMNVVLRPKDYERYRSLVRLEPLLFVEGILEKKEGIINVIAKTLANLR